MADSSSPSPERRADELCARMLDQGLTDPQHAELTALLSQNAAVRAKFREAVCLHAMLRSEAHPGKCGPLSSQLFGVRPDELAALTERMSGAGWEDARRTDAAPNESIATRAGRKWAGRPALALAMGLLLMALCYETFLRPRVLRIVSNAPPAKEQAPESKPEISRPVAQLTYTSGCMWGDAGHNFPTVNSHIHLGDEVVLQEGIAEFRLSSGVSINVEGPSALVITSPSTFILQHGTTTVFVPAGVKDFRLTAASCRFSAAAAEFGVQVAGGHVDVHAFSGTVIASTAHRDQREEDVEIGGFDVQRGRDTQSAGELELMEATIAPGRSLSLNCTTDAVMISERRAADESRFATRLSMAGSLPVTPSYVKTVRKAGPIGYWRFETTKKDMVPNETGELGGLVICGKVYFPSSGTNRAVEIGRPGFDGAMYCQNELNFPPNSDYSVEAWIKPSHFHNGAILSMTVGRENGKASAGFYLQTTAASTRYLDFRQRVRFLHRDPPGGDSTTGTNCISRDPYRLRRWQHVVAVKQGAKMSLYLDGKLVDAAQDPSHLRPRLRIIVGQLGETAGVHRFIGQMDELAIYSRALTPAEIQNHFNLVDSQSPANSVEVDAI